MSSTELYSFKKLIKMLKSKRGRGTELISLYIPPGRSIYDVSRYLRQEYDQASNIKDKLTRKNVQSAIESILQRLKLYKRTPVHGLAIFCGAIPRGQERGTEKIEIYVIEPPEPVPSFKYVCDHEFYLEPLENMAKEKRAYGLIVMDRGSATLAVLRGSSYRIESQLTSDIPPKHSAGGQSQRRFERIREERVQHFFTKVGKEADKVFLPIIDELEGIIIGGPGDAREFFASGDYLDYRLKKKIIGNLPLSYTEEQGVRELILKSENLLSRASLFREKEEVDCFFSTLSKRPGLVTYGVKDVVEKLRSGVVEKVLVLDDLEVHPTRIKCMNCGFTEERYLSQDDVEILRSEGWTCPQCGATSYELEERDLVEYLSEIAKETRAEILIISSKNEWGQQLKPFGGVVAVLRYEV